MRNIFSTETTVKELLERLNELLETQSYPNKKQSGRNGLVYVSMDNPVHQEVFNTRRLLHAYPQVQDEPHTLCFKHHNTRSMKPSHEVREGFPKILISYI